MVETERIELSTVGCRPTVFPLALRPHFGVTAENRTPVGRVTTFRFATKLRPHLELATRFELARSCLRGRRSVLTSITSKTLELSAGIEPAASCLPSKRTS